MIKTSINKFLRIKETIQRTNNYNKYFKSALNEGMSRQQANDYARLVLLTSEKSNDKP